MRGQLSHNFYVVFSDRQLIVSVFFSCSRIALWHLFCIWRSLFISMWCSHSGGKFNMRFYVVFLCGTRQPGGTLYALLRAGANRHGNFVCIFTWYSYSHLTSCMHFQWYLYRCGTTCIHFPMVCAGRKGAQYAVYVREQIDSGTSYALLRSSRIAIWHLASFQCGLRIAVGHLVRILIWYSQTGGTLCIRFYIVFA